jgi:hypothetical protein
MKNKLPLTIKDAVDILRAESMYDGVFRASCPAHADRQRSLTIRKGDDGEPLFACIAGCSHKAIEAGIHRKPRIYTADRLASMVFTEPNWAVPELIPEGVTILAGKPKVKKSWLALGLGISIATGGTALGQIKVNQGDVLYLALEDSERRMADRLQKLLVGNPLPQRLHIVHTWPSIGDGAMADIDHWITQAKQPRLIIIDTLKKVKRGRGAKDMYDHDYDVMSRIHTVAHSHGIAILIIHHTRKSEVESDPMDEISGSLGLTGAADASLVLKIKRGEDDATMHLTGRDIEDDTPFAMAWDRDTCTWQITERSRFLDATPEREQILRTMERWKSPMTVKLIAGELGRDYESTKRIIGRMCDDGEIQQVGGDRKNGYQYQVIEAV